MMMKRQQYYEHDIVVNTNMNSSSNTHRYYCNSPNMTLTVLIFMNVVFFFLTININYDYYSHRHQKTNYSVSSMNSTSTNTKMMMTTKPSSSSPSNNYDYVIQMAQKRANHITKQQQILVDKIVNNYDPFHNISTEYQPRPEWKYTNYPNINIIGLPKAGTSQLYSILTSHSQLYKFKGSKEYCYEMPHRYKPKISPPKTSYPKIQKQFFDKNMILSGKNTTYNNNKTNTTTTTTTHKKKKNSQCMS